MGLRNCIEEGAVYAGAATAGAAVVGAGAGLAPVVGGLYGCLGPGGGWDALQGAWSDARKGWRATSRTLDRAWRWVTRGATKKTRWARPARPLTRDEALAVVAHSYEHRPGPSLYLPRGSKWERVAVADVLTPEVIAGVYGEDLAVEADPAALARLWWGFWTVTVEHRPEWDGATRLLLVVLRVGDYLRTAQPGRIEDWPLLPESGSVAGRSSEASRASVEVLAAHDGPEESVARGGAAELPPEAALWLLVSAGGALT